MRPLFITVDLGARTMDELRKSILHAAINDAQEAGACRYLTLDENPDYCCFIAQVGKRVGIPVSAFAEVEGSKVEDVVDEFPETFRALDIFPLSLLTALQSHWDDFFGPDDMETRRNGLRSIVDSYFADGYFVEAFYE